MTSMAPIVETAIWLPYGIMASKLKGTLNMPGMDQEPANEGADEPDDQIADQPAAAEQQCPPAIRQ